MKRFFPVKMGPFLQRKGGDRGDTKYRNELRPGIARERPKVTSGPQDRPEPLRQRGAPPVPDPNRWTLSSRIIFHREIGPRRRSLTPRITLCLRTESRAFFEKKIRQIFPFQIQLYGFNAELYHNMSEAQHKSQGIVGISLMVQVRERSVCTSINPTTTQPPPSPVKGGPPIPR